jgi:hypothetical protein
VGAKQRPPFQVHWNNSSQVHDSRGRKSNAAQQRRFRQASFWKSARGANIIAAEGL